MAARYSKGMISILTMVLFSIMLIGCGDTNDSNAETSNEVSTNAEENNVEENTNTEENNENADENTEEETPANVKTDGLEREVEVPENPERIVALNNVGELVALGVEPVGTTDYHLDRYSEELPEDVVSVGGDEPNVEKILELDPDLIIISSYQQDFLESLEMVAPTIATSWGLSAPDQLSFVAEMIGMEEEETAWHEKYEAQVENARSELEPHLEEGAQAVVLQFYDKTIYEHSTEVFSALYDGAGLEPTEQAAEVTETASLSEEAVPEFAEGADYMFLLVEDPSDEEKYNELKNTVWQNLKAVENDQVFLVDSTTWSDWNVTTMEWQLADIVERIAD